jgi:group I intron endonuclease
MNKKNIVSKLRMEFLRNRNYMDRSGIYMILNTKNGKFYIGQSKCMLERKKAHFESLRLGRHGNKHLQNSYNLYGKSCFDFLVIEPCKVCDLLDREQYWIEMLEPEYNIVHNVFVIKNQPDEIKEYYSEDETFIRPDWHAWVYGGARNPMLDIH